MLEIARTLIGPLLASLVLAGCASVVPVSFPAIGWKSEGLTLQGKLTMPRGVGPFPAVVLMHGCRGIIRDEEEWALLLANWGYVSLQPDSFGPRGETSVCDDESRISWYARAFDAHAAKAYLESGSFVRKDRIAVMGWGAGAWAVMYAVDNPPQARPWPSQFRAAVAFYPNCLDALRGPPPLMILIGDRDEFFSPQRCRAMRIEGARGDQPELIVYPGVRHSFDRRVDVRNYDGAATSDSEKRVKDFLARHLLGGLTSQ